MKIHHFSESPGIEEFIPRAPLRYPEAEPMVWAIDERHSPLYWFPRDCPRIGVWKDDSPIRVFIQADWVTFLEEARLWRYDFDSSGWEDCHDHGCWVSRVPVRPLAVELLTDLPTLHGHLEVVDSLARLAESLYDYERSEFRTDEHVSMIRLSNLTGWSRPSGKPVSPPRDLS